MASKSNGRGKGIVDEPEDFIDTDEPETNEPETDEPEDGDTDETTDKRKTRVAMPFGRPFGITIKFHNDLPAPQRDSLISDILAQIDARADGETTDTHRSTRGEPNPNLQTWLVAPYGYDWPESNSKERGVRIPQGKLAEALRKFAAKNNVSMEKAAEMFAEAFGIAD